MSDAEKREARRQRILAKGGDRLSKIVNTGRGEDYVGLDTKPVPEKDNTVDAAAPSAVSTATAAAAGAPPSAGTQPDPLTAMMESLQRQAPGSDTTDPTALLRSMLQGASGPAPAPEPVNAVAVARAQRFEREQAAFEREQEQELDTAIASVGARARPPPMPADSVRRC